MPLYRLKYPQIVRILSQNSHLSRNAASLCTSAVEKTHPNVVHSPLKEISFTSTTIPEFVFENFGKFPNKTAVECCLTGRKYTFEQLREKSKNFGKALRKKFKLKKGDIVALVLPNIPEFPICLLGALDAGLAVTPINNNYKPDEIRKQIIDSNPKVVITIGQLWPSIQIAMDGLSQRSIPIIAVKLLQSETLPSGTIDFQECVDTRYDLDDVKDIDFNALAMMPYSSGTTGLPKGVELSNKNVVSNLRQLEDPLLTLTDATTENNQDVVPGILPWFHIYGSTAIMLTNLHNLSKLLAVPKFTPDIYMNMLYNYKPQVLYIVPPIVVMMNNSSLITKDHLQSINVICSGAAPLGAIEEEKLQRKADKEITLMQGYGLTESSCCVAILSPFKKRELKLYGSVGDPVSNTSIKVVPADNVQGEPLGPNESGEILVKGPQMTKGYHNRPQETEDIYHDGWFRTGDIGYYDKHRCFYITDRLKELIKVKAFQVAPAELEGIIRDFPGVVDAAVIGIPHERFGEVPRAYIVAKQGVNIDTKSLERYVASKVADFKRIKGGIFLLDSIPKTATGKIIRKELRMLSEMAGN